MSIHNLSGVLSEEVYYCLQILHSAKNSAVQRLFGCPVSCVHLTDNRVSSLSTFESLVIVLSN